MNFSLRQSLLKSRFVMKVKPPILNRVEEISHFLKIELRYRILPNLSPGLYIILTL